VELRVPNQIKDKSIYVVFFSLYFMLYFYYIHIYNTYEMQDMIKVVRSCMEILSKE